MPIQATEPTAIGFRTMDGIRIPSAENNSRPEVVNTGHFVWEEAAGEYGSLIADWVTR